MNLRLLSTSLLLCGCFAVTAGCGDLVMSASADPLPEGPNDPGGSGDPNGCTRDDPSDGCSGSCWNRPEGERNCSKWTNAQTKKVYCECGTQPTTVDPTLVP